MSLLERITERRAELSQEADRLRKRLAEAEEELERMTIAQQVVMHLTEESGGTAAGERPGDGRHTASAPAPPAQTAIPHRAEAAGAAELPGAYRDLLEAVARTGAPTRCKQICQELGLGTEPRHVEATRSKLNRLAERGWLRRNGAGMFTTVP